MQSISRSFLDVGVVFAAAVMAILPNDTPQLFKEPDNESCFCLFERAHNGSCVLHV